MGFKPLMEGLSVSFGLRRLGKNDTKMRVARGFYALQAWTIYIYFGLGSFDA